MGKIVYPFMASGKPSEMEDSEPSQNLSNRQEVKRIIARLDSLPAIPAVAARILNLLSEEEPDLDEVARLIETDQAITLKLLAMVNSASFSSSRVSSLARAMLVLGTSQIRYTLLSLTISDSLIKPLRQSSTDPQKASWKHCLACAVFAEMLAEALCPNLKAEAFVGGLVHDVGRLILEESVSEKYQEVLKAQSERKISLIEAEQEILGIDHTIVGKWLAEKWSLPDLIVESIWLHHHPPSSLAELDFVKHREIIAIVYLSSLMAHSIMADSSDYRHPEADCKEAAEFLGIKAKDLEKMVASVGRRYGERATIMELDGEGETSFYFQSLQRANRKLAQMAAETAHAGELETVVSDLQFVHELQLELSRIEESEEVLLRTAASLIKHFKREEGIVYYLDRPIRKISGLFWKEGKLSGNFSLDLDDELMPVRTNKLIFNDILDKLIRSYNSRFLRASNGSHQLKMLQYYKPYLIVPMSEAGEFIGEIIVYERRRRQSAPINKMDLKTYGYLASVAASALARIGLNEKEKETAESLGRALLKNSQALSQLKQTKEMFEYLFDYSNDAILLHNKGGVIRRANQRASELLGYTGRELCTMSLLDLLTSPAQATESSQAACDRLQTHWRSEHGGRTEIQLKTKDLGVVDIEISSRTVDESSGLVQSILRDITIQREAAQALAAEKERLAVTLRSIGEGVVATNGEGAIVLINQFAEKLTGYSEKEALGRPCHQVFCLIDTKTGKCYEDLLERVLKAGEVIELSNRASIRTRQGAERKISASCAPIRNKDGGVIGAILVFRDMSEKEKMEREVMKVQKLESISTLAGGIAHDFNNILSAIMGNLSLARMYAGSGAIEKVQARLEDADKASLRARDLTNQLLTFSKEGAPVKQIASIAEIIRDSASFVMSGSKSKCRFDIDQDLWSVEADIGQISQVINNLVINARQAMPNGGTIHIRAKNLTDPDIPGTLPERGNYVEITVEDEGGGISEENLPKIFDPYFTTKPAGHGLGLATSYSIIRNHGGNIAVESKVGEGTAFNIFLPASSAPAGCENNPAQALPEIGGKILVMDDEESIRDVIKMMLEHSGCETVFARDGAEAIALYGEALKSGKPFDVVIMDLTIPGGMGGREALEKLLELDPDVHAIGSSGYSKDPVIADFRKYGFKAAIAKPFKIEELYEAMESCGRRRA